MRQSKRNRELVGNGAWTSGASRWVLPIGTIAAAIALHVTSDAAAQPAEIPARVQPVEIDSGVRANHEAESLVVFTDLIELGPDVPWARILFDREGTVLAPGSVVRVTSLLDGESHTLNTQDLENWGYGTAFFNGSMYIVQLIAGANTVGNSLRIREVYVGVRHGQVHERGEGRPDDGDDGGDDFTVSICGGVDTREPSSDRRVARLTLGTPQEPGVPQCTAFIIDRPAENDTQNRLHLSAGHCFRIDNVPGSGNWDQNQNFPLSVVLQFNIPKSLPDCTPQHPPVPDQFPVDVTRLISRDNEVGNDHAAFWVHRNKLGSTTYQHAQKQAFGLKDPGDNEDFSNVRVTGYGDDGTDNCACGDGPDPDERRKRWATQQTATGDAEFVSRHCTSPKENSGNRCRVDSDCDSAPGADDGVCSDIKPRIRHTVDTCVGNSGSPIINEDNGQVIGIHTHGNCKTDGHNSGTPISNPDLQQTIEALEEKKPEGEGCCWRKNEEGELKCNSPVQPDDCDEEDGWTFVAEKDCGDPECGATESCEQVGAKLQLAQYELQAVATILGTLAELVIDPEADPKEIEEWEQKALSGLQSAQALLQKAIGAVQSLIDADGGENCPSTEKLEEILEALGGIKVKLTLAEDLLMFVIDNPQLTPEEKKNLYEKVAFFAGIAAEQFKPIIEQLDPLLVPGCCWRKVEGVIECDDNVLELHCDSDFSFVSGASCGEPACGGSGNCGVVLAKLHFALDELDEVAALLEKVVGLINDPRADPQVIEQKLNEALERLISALAYLDKTKALLMDLILEGGADDCPDPKELEAIHSQLSFLNFKVADAIENLLVVIHDDKMTPKEKKEALNNLLFVVFDAAKQLEGVIDQLDPPTPTGCCWLCVRGMAVCNNNVPEDECKHIFAPDGQCGTNECGEGKCVEECIPSWSPEFEGSAGMNGTVHSLVVFDDGSGAGPALYAAGTFTMAGGVPANRVAKWDGESWSPLGSGMNATVRALAVFDDGSGSALYAGGLFTTAGGVSASRIARWDGASWSPVGPGINDGVYSLEVFDDDLYAGGFFSMAGGVPATSIAKWDGESWSPLGSGMNWTVLALTVFDDGLGGGQALYAGGLFTTAGGVSANRIARWDGVSWSPLGAGMNLNVETLTVHDDGLGGGPALYAGGFFTLAGGVEANRIAKWDGEGWSPVGTGMDGGVNTLAVHEDESEIGPALYAGGVFTTAGDSSANRVAMWDGLQWSALGEGMNNNVEVLTIFDDGLGKGPALYAGGAFTEAGGMPANRFAKWQGCPDEPKPECPIPADLNCDGVVDGADLLILLSNWGECADPNDCPADLNGDGSVDGADLLILLSNWG